MKSSSASTTTCSWRAGSARLSWREVSLIFKTSWENVYRSAAWVVEYGLQSRSLDGVTASGVDEGSLADDGPADQE